MEEEIFEFYKLLPDEMEEKINTFIKNNSNEEGIDLSKVYIAYLSYSKPIECVSPFLPYGYHHYFGINCPINKTSDYKKPTIVFIQRSQSNTDHVFIDLFNKELLQSSYVNKDGVFSLIPEFRRGVTVSKYYPLNEIFKINRVSYQELEFLYKFIANYQTDTLRKLSKEDLSSTLISDLKEEKNKRKEQTIEEKKNLSEKEELSKNTDEILDLIVRNTQYLYENVPGFYIGQKDNQDVYSMYNLKRKELADYFWREHTDYEFPDNHYLKMTFDFRDNVIFRFWPKYYGENNKEKEEKRMKELEKREDNNRSVIKYIEYFGEPEILIESFWELKRKEMPINLYKLLTDIQNNGFNYGITGDGKLEVSISVQDFKKKIENQNEDKNSNNKGKHKLIKTKPNNN